jgi:hypothetical protein
VTLATTQIAVEEAVVHKEAQGRRNSLGRAHGEWRVALAGSTKQFHVGAEDVVDVQPWSLTCRRNEEAMVSLVCSLFLA